MKLAIYEVNRSEPNLFEYIEGLMSNKNLLETGYSIQAFSLGI